MGKGWTPPGAVRAEHAVILGPDLALHDLLDIAAAADPVAAQFGEAGHDVDPRLRVGIGAGAVVDAQRRLAGRRLEVDLTHRHPELADMDLARSADRAGGDLEFGAGRPFGFAQDRHIGHLALLIGSESTGLKPLPPSAGVSRIRFGGSQLQLPLNRSGAVPRGR